MQKPDNLVALHKQMTGSYVVDASPLEHQPLDKWALNLIRGLQADRERLVEALDLIRQIAQHPPADRQVLRLAENALAEDAGISGEDGG